MKFFYLTGNSVEVIPTYPAKQKSPSFITVAYKQVLWNNCAYLSMHNAVHYIFIANNSSFSPLFCPFRKELVIS